ncbi:MAG: dTDP-4-dehydrorhamnose reductase [Chthoniobacterales bacterium]|nr:dTDP-4-dehydrorhamnose reductase [Chthoniobacterales bacterium]
MDKPKVFILGAKGRLGAALARTWAADSEVSAYGRSEADLARPASIAGMIRSERPDVVVNCAAMTNVDECETSRDMAEAVNATAPGVIAQATSAAGGRFVHISTDYVFSGDAASPYAEEAIPQPVSWYGETKRRGEVAVMAAGEHHAVIRVAWVFGPDRDSFIDKALHAALRGEPVRAVADKYSSPTYTRDAAEGLRPFLRDGAPGGIYHLCNSGVCTWQQWAQEAIDAAAKIGVPVKTRLVEPLKLADIKAMAAKRPVYSPMSCSRIEALLGHPMRGWREAVDDYVRLLRDEGRLAAGC